MKVHADLLEAYDNQVRAAEASHLAPGVYAEADGPIVRIVGQHQGFISAPVELGIEGDALSALIARQRDFFAERGEGVEWKTRGHDRPAEVFEQLRAAGFTPEDQETVMIGRVAELAGMPSPLPQGVTIRRTTKESDLQAVAAMESEVWGDDLSWMANDLIGRVGLGPDAIAVFVAEAVGQVVSGAWLVSNPPTEFAGLWGGSTRANWRGRGIYRALVRERAQLAASWGATYLQVDASDNSRPILERLGFIAVTTTTPYVWKPGMGL
ncbi:MAG: GNAT family N-acetyltransferase [Acidimicrobiales bacterium]